VPRSPGVVRRTKNNTWNVQGQSLSCLVATPLILRLQAVQNETAFTGHDQSGAIFLVALAAYFLLHVLVRIVLSGSLELDEAEQVFAFQQPGLGYGTQPPLYAWLQWLMFSVFGVNLFALAALKNLLLFATCLGMFRLARPMLGVRGAMAVSASLLLLPAIGWESQVDRSHSVLLVCLACATLWCYFALLRHPRPTGYALFGLLVGMGLQSKYNFLIFIAGLATASLLTAQHRRILWNRRAWIAVVMALLCVLPHGFWLVNHLDEASGGTLYKISMGDEDAGYLRDVAGGLQSMLVAALAFITPLWLIYGLISRRYWKEAVIDRHNPDARFFIRLYLAFLAWMMALLLSGEVGTIQSRWMLPLLFSMPLAFFVVLPGLARIAVFQRVLHVAGFAAILILLAIALRVYLGPTLGRYVRVHHPYPQLSVELARRFPQARTVIADDALVAGNLYFHRPAVRTLILDEVLKASAPPEGPLLLVVRDGTQNGGIARFRAACPRCSVQQHGRLNLRYGDGGGEIMSFDYALVCYRTCECRGMG
jgi:4-amino-4-deoxy-L-arabinose transferase-like glycosyltransferase